MAKLIDLIVSGKSSFANDVNAKDIYADKFIKNGSSSSYVLLGDGSHKKWNSAYEANTIVARDANGYIFATYYNSNISNEDTITIGSVYVRNTSDNWIRRMSFTKFVDNLYSNGLDGRYVNVSGDTMTGLLTVKTGSSNNGIKAGNTYINSIEGSLIFQNNTALRFGGADWDWNVWAGLKYVHSSKTIYLGLADNNAFTANSAQSGGKIYFPGIDNLYIGHGTYKLWHEGNDGSGSGLDADLLDGLHSSSYAIWRGVVNTDPTAADVTSTDTSDFLTRLHNTSNLFGTNFSAFRGSWWYAGNTQVNTGVGTLEMAGTAVLNMSHSTGAGINYKSLLFLTAYGELYSFASEESGVATWSRYSKHGHTHDDRYYTESEADGRFVNVTGDTMSGSLTLKGSTSDNMTYSGNVHPFISFDNSDSSQNVRILFTDYDSYRSPAGLKIVGNQGNEWLEVAGVTYGPGFCHTSYASATYLLRSDGGAAAFNWSGQGGQPTWLWGGNTQHAYYVYNPSNFSVAYSAQSTAAANWGGTGSTTKIKIKINSTASWMLCFVVTLYQGYSATKVMISGYNYGSNYWYEPEAVLLGNSNAATSISVYFGYDSAWNLWVGFDGGSYTGVSVSDVTNGYTQITSLKDLFTISNVSSLTTLQTTVTATNTVMYSDNTTNVYVNQHTGNDVEYPLVWSNQNNTGSHRSNQLYKSYSNLTYNPSNKGVTAGQFKANNSAGPHFTGTSSTGSWAYLRLNNSSNVWDIATNTSSGSGGLWLSRYGGLDNGIFVSASSTPKVGINTSSPSYALHVINDAYATGWARAGSGFYVEGKGVHYMSNNASGLGQIYLTSNEFNWSASTTTLYFNYRASANGTTVTSYVWNAGSSSTYANHTTGKIDAKSHVLTTDNFGINSTAGSGRGISLYGGSDYVGTYGIAFNQTSNWGTHGYVTGDWATYFTMSNTENRGWIFRAGSNRFSIDGDGHAYANGLVNANYFNSRVATGTQPYACTSTTLNTNLNADLLDGSHGSRYTRALGGPNHVTVTVGGDAATYYPVVISSVADYYPMQLVNISRHYSETAPNSWHTSTHKGGLTCTLLWNGSTYWDGNSSGGACYCVYVNQSYSTTLGGFGNSTHGKVVWLRGGGATYHIHAMNGTSVSAIAYTSTFTDSASQSFAPTTSVKSYSVRWPGYAEGADYATSAGNADTVDGQHFSYSNSSNSPTYLWGTNSNGSSFLAARGSISVNYANYAGYTTKLRRRDDSSDYSLQHHWTGTYWYLRGYSGDSYHAGVQVEYANNAGNADTVDGLHAHTQNLNNQANKLVRTEGNGYIQTSYIYYGGNEKNNSNPTYVAGFNGSDNYIRSYNTAYLRVSNADMVDDIHANRFAFIYNSANYNASSSLTLTDIAANANSNAHMGMIYAGTDNPVSTSGNWVHVWSQSWTRGSTASWCSQIALGVQAGTGMWYRTTSGALAGRGWNRVLDSANYTSYVNNYYWANVKISQSSNAGTYPTFANMQSTGRVYLGEWIQFSGGSGLYWPNANGAHLYANTTTSYAGLMTQGARNGYCGLHCGPNTNYMTVMSTDVHHGLYCENTGTWEFYYNRSSGGVGIRTSSITKNFNVSGQSYLSSNTWIGTTSGSEMLNVGGWVGTTGATGWYNISYGGGIYMTDTTWVRTYNSKKFYVSNTDDDAIYTAGGFKTARTSGTALYMSDWGAIGCGSSVPAKFTESMSLTLGPNAVWMATTGGGGEGAGIGVDGNAITMWSPQDNPIRNYDTDSGSYNIIAQLPSNYQFGSYSCPVFSSSYDGAANSTAMKFAVFSVTCFSSSNYSVSKYMGANVPSVSGVTYIGEGRLRATTTMYYTRCMIWGIGNYRGSSASNTTHASIYITINFMGGTYWYITLSDDDSGNQGRGYIYVVDFYD